MIGHYTRRVIDMIREDARDSIEKISESHMGPIEKKKETLDVLRSTEADCLWAELNAIRAVIRHEDIIEELFLAGGERASCGPHLLDAYSHHHFELLSRLSPDEREEAMRRGNERPMSEGANLYALIHGNA